jgi:hypothetical protein
MKASVGVWWYLSEFLLEWEVFQVKPVGKIVLFMR